MPTRKQRRKREKTFRHEYGFVTYDDDGNEIEVDPSEVRPEKEKPERPKAKAATTRGGRPLREPPVPSWQRSIKRGSLFGGLMFFVVVFLFKGQSLALRLGTGLVYAVAFVPLTYWIDRVTYRSYLRRSGKA
jgi:hypothetical protein